MRHLSSSTCARASKADGSNSNTGAAAIYSQYQLLALPMLVDLLDRQTHQQRGKHRIARIPTPHPVLLETLRVIQAIL